MHARVSLHLVKRQGDLYSRRAVSTGASQRADILAGAGELLLHFPAIGIAVFATKASRVTDKMFIEPAHAVADQVPSELLKQGLLYPLQANILETEIQTAARVAKLVFDSGLARVPRPADMVAFIREHVYKPEYRAEAVPPTKAA